MHILKLSQEMWGKLWLPYKVIGKRPNELCDCYHNMILFFKRKEKKTSVMHWILCTMINCILKKRWQKSLDNWSRLISSDYVHYDDNLESLY